MNLEPYIEFRNMDHYSAQIHKPWGNDVLPHTMAYLQEVTTDPKGDPKRSTKLFAPPPFPPCFHKRIFTRLLWFLETYFDFF